MGYEGASQFLGPEWGGLEAERHCIELYSPFGGAHAHPPLPLGGQTQMKKPIPQIDARCPFAFRVTLQQRGYGGPAVLFERGGIEVSVEGFQICY